MYHKKLVLVVIAHILTVALADQCDPRKYDITTVDVSDPNNKLPVVASSQAYCADYMEGGVSYGWGTWMGPTCYHKTNINDPCPCTGYDYYDTCFCAAAYDRTVGYCYQSAKECIPCTVGTNAQSQALTYWYRIGCGCVQCGTSLDPLADRYFSIYARPVGYNDCYKFQGRYLCGEGTCNLCPKGHMCPNSFNAIPCPNGTYQDQEGQASCKQCACPAGMFAPSPVCDPVLGFSTTCVVCDRCVDNGNNPYCNIYDPTYAYFLTPDPSTNSRCRRCLLCSGKAYAVFSSAPYCVTDDTAAGKPVCIEQYRDEPCDLSQPRTTSCPTPTIGSMPWRGGFRRVNGRQYTPGIASEGGDPGMLPYYSACPTAPDGYVPRSSTAGAQLSSMDWSRDCDTTLAYECATGYYATVAPYYSSPEGLAILQSCTPCAHGSSGGGGLTAACTCAAGTASLGALLQAFPPGVDFFVPDAGDDSRECVSCLHQVWWAYNGNNDDVRQQAILCPAGGATPTFCTGLNYVGSTCQACTGGSIPNATRTGCMLCPPGKHTAMTANGYYECAQCPDGQYQDRAGQSACLPKRASCSPGYVLALTSEGQYTADNDCQPCGGTCGDGQIVVLAPNASVTCDGYGGNFFACYDGTQDGSGPPVPLGYQLSYPVATNPDGSVATGTRAVLQRCADLPPSNADWVQYTRGGGGIHCYFACLHGISAANAARYNDALKQHVYHNRTDLLPFLVVEAAAAAAGSAQRASMPSVWLYDDNSGSQPSPDSWAYPTQWTLVSVAAATNTFLYVPGFSDAAGVCLPPSLAYSAACPRGFASSLPPSSSNTFPCALAARNTGLFRATRGTATQLVVLGGGSSTTSMACVAADADLHLFQNVASLCGAAPCLDASLAAARAAAFGELPSSVWSQRFMWMATLLSARYWYTQFGLFNPYVAASGSSCDTRCDRTTFRWSSLDHANDHTAPPAATQVVSVCVPCAQAQGSTICYQFSPPRYFLPSACDGIPGVGELNTSHVCVGCSPTIQLPPPSALLAEAIDAGSPAYAEWLRQRSTLGRGDDWASIQCRYGCPANYTSNMDFATYKTAPCISCSAALDLACSSASSSAAYYYTSAASCGASDNNYAPFLPECMPCSAMDTSPRKNTYIFYATPGQQAVRGSAQCLARCNPDLYHTYDLSAKRMVASTPVLFGIIQCIPCAGDPSFSCNGTCIDGYYYNLSQSNDCVPCTTAPCRDGFYRELCVMSSQRDARCLPCPNSSLLNVMNGSDGALVLETWGLPRRAWLSADEAALALHNGVPFVKAVPSAGGPTECALRCVNNYAWIDTSTGLSPFPRPPSAASAGKNGNSTKSMIETTAVMMMLDSVGLACVACSSLMAPTASYSFWNGSLNTSAHAMRVPPALVAVEQYRPTVASMQNVAGGCYLCQDNYDVDFATSAQLCELVPGYTAQDQGDAAAVAMFTTTLETANVTSVQVSSLIDILPTPRIPPPPSSRRLLQQQQTTATSSSAQAVQAVRSILVRVQPVPSGTDYFAICTQTPGTAAEQEKCKRLNTPAWESAKYAVGAAWSAARRRLLSSSAAQQQEEACYSGSYKPERGDSPCYYCPTGSSTTGPFYDAAASLASCVCLPGYYYYDNSECRPCPEDTYSRGGCAPCPALMSTMGLVGSAYCYCVDGAYAAGDEGCVLCPPGFYCNQQGRRFRCPPNSMSQGNGSSQLSDCICDPVNYYGVLSEATPNCLLRPPAVECAHQSSGEGAAVCGCAYGWKQQEGYDGQLRCSSGCAPGTFAAMVPRSQALAGCRPCPQDTYATTGDLLSCTACPPGKTTGGMSGSVSVDNCTCATSACAACDANYYYDGATCAPCPAGMASPKNSVGAASCLCPPGTSFFSSAGGCAPCVKGTYSHSVGAVCTPCPPGYSTSRAGATSLLDCRPLLAS